jgi:hypothetical protein
MLESANVLKSTLAPIRTKNTLARGKTIWGE